MKLDLFVPFYSVNVGHDKLCTVMYCTVHCVRTLCSLLYCRTASCNQRSELAFCYEKQTLMNRVFDMET